LIKELPLESLKKEFEFKLGNRKNFKFIVNSNEDIKNIEQIVLVIKMK